MGSDKMSMCRVLAQPTLESQAYTVSAELLNQAGWQGINSGHLGLLFNARDENNFDFVYFRWVLSPSFNGARLRDGQSEWSSARARVTRACCSHDRYSRTCCSNACCFLAECHLCGEFFGRPFQDGVRNAALCIMKTGILLPRFLKCRIQLGKQNGASKIAFNYGW